MREERRDEGELWEKWGWVTKKKQKFYCSYMVCNIKSHFRRSDYLYMYNENKKEIL